MKAHIGVDAESGLLHTVRGTSGHVSDIAEANTLLHGKESIGFGDTRYQGFEKRPDAEADVTWHVAMRPGKRRGLDKGTQADALLDKAEKPKAGVRAKIKRLFRAIQRQFGFVNARYRGEYVHRGLKKNTAQLFTLFAPSNLWMVRSKLMGGRGMSATTTRANTQKRAETAS